MTLKDFIDICREGRSNFEPDNQGFREKDFLEHNRSLLDILEEPY